jgi:hypothetical protein
VTGELKGDGTGMRPALEAIRAASDDEVAARDVLSSVATRRPTWTPGEPVNLRCARSRLSMTALVELRPHDLRTAEPINVTRLLDSADELAQQIMPHRPATISHDDAAVYSSVGNRILQPDGEGGTVLSILTAASRQSQAGLPQIAGGFPSSHALASHAISADAMAALRDGDRVAFLKSRRDAIEAATVRLIDRHAEWEHSDRLSISALSAEDN